MLQKTPERAAQLDEFASYLEKLPRAKLSFHSWCTCIAGHAIKEYGTDEERRIIRGGVESSAWPYPLWALDTARRLLDLNEDEAWKLLAVYGDGGKAAPEGAAAHVRELMYVGA